MLFYDGNRRDMATINEVMGLFKKANGIMLNGVKPSMYPNVMSWDEVSYAHNLFPYLTLESEYGLKYFGFILNHHKYWKHDKKRIIAKIEKRVKSCCCRWILREGR